MKENLQQLFYRILFDWKAFFSKNSNFLIYGIIWCIISFGFELFQYTESPDDEVFQLPTTFRFWAIQGRFTYGYVLGCFFGSLSVPFFALFFSQLCMFAAYIFAFVQKKEVHGVLHYIAMPLFLSAPILFYGYAFNILTPIIGFGFLFSIFSVLLFEKKNWFCLLGGLACGVIAIGCYQVFFPVIILFLLFQLVEKLDKAPSFKSFIKEALLHVVFALGCYFCYAVTVKIILWLNKIQMSSYITDMVSLAAPWRILFNNFCSILKNIAKIYAGSPRVYFERVSFLIPLMLLLGVLLLWNVFYRKKEIYLFWQKIFFVILHGFIVLIPFLFFFLGIAQNLITYRTTMGVALVLPFLFIETWKIPLRIYFKALMVVLASVCLLQFLYVNSKMSYICYLREKQDDHVTQYILNQLLPASKEWPREAVYIYYQGHLPIHPMLEHFISGRSREAIGASILNDGNNRFHNLLKKKMYSNFELMPPDKFPEIEDELLKMPCYPEKGFAKFVNGIAVVKMGTAIPDSVRSFSKYKYRITEVNNVKDCYLVDPASPQIGKKIWQGSKNTLNVANHVIVKHLDNFKFETQGIGVDPGIYFTHLPKDLPENICIRIKYATIRADILQFYFYNIPPKKGDRDSSVHLSSLEGHHEIAIVMPSDVFEHTHVRLDPGARGSFYSFENVSIHEYHKDQEE